MFLLTKLPENNHLPLTVVVATGAVDYSTGLASLADLEQAVTTVGGWLSIPPSVCHTRPHLKMNIRTLPHLRAFRCEVGSLITLWGLVFQWQQSHLVQL